MAGYGWIKAYREIQNHWLWEDKPFSKGQAWLDLVMMANHRENKFVLGNELVEVERGQFITSELKLMEKWGWSKTKVRSFLELLQNDGMIVKKSDRKKTTINIVKYSVYQDSETTDEPQKNHRRTTEEPQKDTNKNEKNEKKINLDQFDEIWSLYPRKLGKAKVIKRIPDLIHQYGFEQMIRTVTRYKNEVKGKDVQFIQHGSTFFTSGFMDYLDQEATKPISKIKREVITLSEDEIEQLMERKEKARIEEVKSRKIQYEKVGEG